GIEQPEFVTLPNGVDTDENRPRGDLRADTRRQLELAPQDVVFLAFSRLGQSTKGDQRSLVSLWKHVLEAAPRAVLLLSGAGTSDAARTLRELASSLGIADRVIVRPNPYADWPDAKQRLMSAADAFVHMSTGVEETFPLTTLEGMSHGLPLVAT